MLGADAITDVQSDATDMWKTIQTSKAFRQRLYPHDLYCQSYRLEIRLNNSLFMGIFIASNS